MCCKPKAHQHDAAFHKTLVHIMDMKSTLRHMPRKCQTSYMFDDTNAAGSHKPSPHSLHSFQGHQRYYPPPTPHKKKKKKKHTHTTTFSPLRL